MSLNFGAKLRELRTKAGLSLDEFAKMVNSKKAYIWQLENKSPARPSGELLLKIASALDTSPEYLIDDESDTPQNDHVRTALARGLAQRDFSHGDLEKLLQIADMMKSDKPKKTDN